jgi:hypothetical protein
MRQSERALVPHISQTLVHEQQTPKRRRGATAPTKVQDAGLQHGALYAARLLGSFSLL